MARHELPIVHMIQSSKLGLVAVWFMNNRNGYRARCTGGYELCSKGVRSVAAGVWTPADSLASPGEDCSCGSGFCSGCVTSVLQMGH